MAASFDCLGQLGTAAPRGVSIEGFLWIKEQTTHSRLMFGEAKTAVYQVRSHMPRPLPAGYDRSWWEDLVARGGLGTRETSFTNILV